MVQLLGSREKYASRFIGRLIELSLGENDFASRVLVLANATYTQEILDYFGNDHLQKMIKRCLSDGDQQAARQEDIDILKWANENFMEATTPTPPYPIGELVLNYNIIRTKRPKGKAANPAYIIYEPFSKSIFLLPGLQKESFAKIETAGKPVLVFYNKYCFNLFHALLFPDIERCLPQYLTREYHEWAWNTAVETVEFIPEFSMGYNSLGAFASQNHLHFQPALCEYPVTKEIWKNNNYNGSCYYPASVAVFTNFQDSWEWIEKANKTNTAYNLLYAKGKIYCFARKMQGSYNHEAWTSGFAFAEMSGWIVIAISEAEMPYPSEAELYQEFDKMTLELR